MRGSTRSMFLGLIVVSFISLLLSTPVQAITVSPEVTLQAGNRMTIHWGAAGALTSIVVGNGSISFDNYELSASNWVNITVTQWPEPGEAYRKVFVFLANTTESTNVWFNLSGPVDEDIASWAVLRDGIGIASGENEDISFVASEWQTAIDRTFQINAEFIGENVGWLIQYGPAWAALLAGAGIMALIFASFWVGIKKRRKGKVWRYMPRKFR